MYFDEAIDTIIKECPDKKTATDLKDHIGDICCEKGTEGLIDLSKKLLLSMKTWKNSRSEEVKNCLEKFINERSDLFKNCTDN